MCTQNISFSLYKKKKKKKKHSKLPQICRYEIFSKGLKNEFKTAMVYEPPVFESLQVYCS